MSVSENELETIERRRKGDLKAKMIRDNKRNGVDNSTNRNIHALCLSSEISLSLEHTKNANIIFRVIPSGMWINLYYNVCVCCNYQTVYYINFVCIESAHSVCANAPHTFHDTQSSSIFGNVKICIFYRVISQHWMNNLFMKSHIFYAWYNVYDKYADVQKPSFGLLPFILPLSVTHSLETILVAA